MIFQATISNHLLLSMFKASFGAFCYACGFFGVPVYTFLIPVDFFGLLLLFLLLLYEKKAKKYYRESIF